jgi:SAM-dependent methyltransferase
VPDGPAPPSGRRPDWAPVEVDVDRPSVARVYDYYLGGSHNFAVDREMARKIVEMTPETVPIARANRAFLRRAVRFCVDAGIRQFLDVGSGIPTVGNVHDVAQGLDPGAKVVYVDIDPVAVAHSKAILAGNDQATVMQADLRDPDSILGHPQLRALLDLDEPVALLMVSVLHLIADEDDPAGIIAKFADAVAPGSYLVVSHLMLPDEALPQAEAAKLATARQQYARTATQLTMRTRDRIADLFTGWELVEPGLTYLSMWRPDSPEDVETGPGGAAFLAGVGRKGPTGR